MSDFKQKVEKKEGITLEKIYHGAALYPELWDREIVEEDIKHMKRLGLNLARIGEFTWATLEPKIDHFDMSVLTEAIEMLHENNIDTIVCTPTPTPPIWMTHNHAERLHQTCDKTPLGHGSRQHVCTNNAYFRERAAKITEKIVLAVKDYPNVIAFQLDNEFKCHVGSCYCETCGELWQSWLQEKYKTIDALNEAWGTAIWSQTYMDFDQVVQPTSTPFLHNSSLTRAYHAFSMEKITEFAIEQSKIIKNNTDIPVTHNSGFLFDIDNEQMFSHLDFVSFDTYTPATNYAGFMMNNDYWPNVKDNNRKYMLLETSTSYAGHIHEYSRLHQEGYVTAESFATYASGAQAFCYWLFRGQKSGCEQPHGSVVSSWGEPTIGYDNVVKASHMLKEIEPILQNSKLMHAKVGITYSDRARSFLVNEPGEAYNYRDMMIDIYKHFLDLGVERKLLPEGDHLEQCSVLFTPFVHYISDEFLEKATTFVENGGVWIVGPMTGDRTEEHTWHTTGGLGKLGEIAGVKNIMQFPATGSGHYGEAFGHHAELSMMSSFFEPKEGTVVKGIVSEGQAKGRAFITERAMKNGKIILVGSMPKGDEGKAIWECIIQEYTKHLKLQEDITVEAGIVIIPRKSSDNKRQYWLVNFTNENKTWRKQRHFTDLLTKKQIENHVNTLLPFGYIILEES